MNIHNLKERGFTLIELLVVIAIIGILASVVLASLNSAREKGSDAAIRSTLNNSRAQAELYYDDNSRSYAGVCDNGLDDTPPGIADALTGATNSGSTDVTCADADAGWTVTALLVSPATTTYYCVDSTGNSADVSGEPADTDWVSGADECNNL